MLFGTAIDDTVVEHAICLDGSKAKRILGFKPTKPRIEVDELKRIVKAFQDDGLWCVRLSQPPLLVGMMITHADIRVGQANTTQMINTVNIS